MSDDILQDLYKLQRYASGLQDLVRSVDQQVQQRFDGRDSSGAVRVALGTDGLPASFEVDYDWRRYLRPEAFGRAVTEAYQVATKSRLEAWARAFNDGDFEARTERLREEVDAAPATPPSIPTPPPAPAGAARPRDPRDFIRDLLETTSDIDALTNAPMPQGVGTTAFGKLSVTLSPAGLVSCTADQFWVSDKSGEELTEALATALTAAREELAQAVSASPASRAGHLLDEAVAILRYMSA